MRFDKQYIISLHSISSPSSDSVGSKGYNLMRLAKLGFLVPSGFIITVKALNYYLEHNDLINLLGKKDTSQIKNKILRGDFPSDLKNQIHHEYTKRGKSLVSVRSSGVNEDLKDASFAGMYDTFLNVDESDLFIKIKECFASAFDRNVVDYSSNDDLDTSGFAIIIQRMLIPSAAGVVFTVEPNTGVNYVTINAVCGLGEGVVSGKKKVQSYIIQSKDMMLISQKNTELSLLSPEKLKKIVEQSIRIQDAFHAPQDIEWAIENNKLYFLQTRPITTLQKLKQANSLDTLIDLDYPIYTDANIGEVLQGTITPLTWTSIGLMLDEGAYKAAHSLCLIKHKPKKNLFFGYFYNRAFLNMCFVYSVVHSFHGISNDDIKRTFVGEKYSQVFKSLNSKANIHSMYRTFLVLSKGFLFVIKNKRDLKHTETEIKKLLKTYDENLGIKEHIQNLDLFKKLSVSAASSHFILSILCTRATANFFNYVKREVNDNGALAAKLLSNNDKLVSVKPAIKLKQIAKKIKSDAKLTSLFKEESANILKEIKQYNFFKEFIRDYGHRGPKEAELMADSWETDPKLIIDILKLYLRNDPDIGRSRHVKIPRLPIIKRIILKNLLNSALKYFAYRERQKNNLILLSNFCRKTVMSLAVIYQKRGWILNREDIYFMTLDEVMSLLGKSDILRRRINIRKKEFYKNTKITNFPSIIDSRIIFKRTNIPSRKRFEGISCYPGRVQGIARVITSPENAKLKAGEILVAPVIDAGWAPLFALAKAIVVDKGGLLSHGSIIAREYKIPTIVDTKYGTRFINDGDQLVVDADNSEVYIR